MLSRTLLVFALIVATSDLARAAFTIGVNFTGGGQLVGPGAQPGLVPGANWNNVVGSSGVNVPLQDDFGAPSGALLSYGSAATFDGFGVPGTPNAATNVMYSGGLVGDNTTSEAMISLSNIPYGSYDVYVFASADTSATNTLSITNVTTTYFYASAGTSNSGVAALLQTTSTNPLSPSVGAAQYQIFSGLSGSNFSLLTGGSINGVISNNVFGLQIVQIQNTAVPVPPTAIIAAIGMLSMAGLRRRQR